MLYEDLCGVPEVQELITAYKRTVTNSGSDTILHRIRLRLLLQQKGKVSVGSMSVPMNRLDAQDFKLTGRHERADECLTLFTQLMLAYKQNFHKLDTQNKEPFQTTFMHELSYDCGGPMRDTIQFICEELMLENVLPLLRPTANNRNNLEPETDCYQLNEKTKESFNLRKLRFLGYLFGWSLLNIGSLNLELPRAFWSRVCGGPAYVYTLDDVAS